MDDPPHVNVTLGEAFAVGWEGWDVLWDEQSQVSDGSFSDQLCRTGRHGKITMCWLHCICIFTLFRILFWMFSDKPKWLRLISISDFILYMGPCYWQYFCSFFLPSNQPMKFLQCWCSSPCFQLRGHETKTALCFRPPSPLAWSRCDVASRRLEDTVTWQKPFTFSVSISLRSA